MFQTPFKCFKHVYNIQNMFIMFKTRLKYLKRVANISTALYSKRVANSRKNIIRGKYQPPYGCLTYCTQVWPFASMTSSETLQPVGGLIS